MTRCLLVHNRYRSAEPSGENVVFDEEAAELARRHHDVEVWTVSSDEIAGYNALQNLRLPFRTVWSGESARQLRTAVRSFRPDVVHLHNTFPLITTSVIPMLRREGVPTVATVHNYRLTCAGGSLYRDGRVCHDCVGKVQWRGVVHGCYRNSSVLTAPIAVGNALTMRQWNQLDAVLALSTAQRSLLVDGGLDDERVVVKPNFVRDYGPSMDTERSGVVYVGRLADTKGVLTIIEAWRELAARGRSIPLQIIGDGPLRQEVVKLAADLVDVRFMGRVDRDVVIEAVRTASAVLLPSSWEETFGLSVVEAMCVGTPVIATSHGSFTDIVTDGHDGFLVLPDDALALVDAAGRLHDDPALVARLGANARHTYETRYTPDVVMSQLEAIYDRVCDRPTGGSTTGAVDGANRAVDA